MPNLNQLLLAVVGTTLCTTACVPEVPVDTKKPTLAEVTAVPYGKDTTPNYTFSSSEAGTITYGGGCTSATTKAVKGNNTITFTALDYGVYSSCTIKVKDAAGNSSSLLKVSSFSVARKPYNDTGITKCGDMAYSYTGYTGSGTHSNNVDCALASPAATKTSAGQEIANGLDAVPAGQDVHFGRDANAATNSDDDGHKGFSFTKLSAVDGSPLVIQNGTWSDAGTEVTGTKWGCVQDNLTGLVWEIKTSDGPRDKDWTYSWYNTNSANNGGSAGTADGGDNCGDYFRCDTEKYLADVNPTNLCGASDWRLPSKEELQTIIARDRYNPSIDTGFFPNTMSGRYWSSSPVASNGNTAWSVHFHFGTENNSFKFDTLYVRLVRGGQ